MFGPTVEPELTRPGIGLCSSRDSAASRGGPVPDIEAHITGTVWKIECKVGDKVEEGDTVVILESMKMEMPVEAEDEGTVKEILCEEGQAVNEGDTLVRLE
jgi:acetyl-CoA carboxylase biotin carboxyl carrier protein